LLDWGIKLDEHDFKSESDGNATPSNLQIKFDEAALDEGTPLKWNIHKTPDTERKWRLIRQETAKKNVYGSPFSSGIIKVLGLIAVVVFLGSFMLHETTLSHWDFEQSPPNDWSPESKYCNNDHKLIGSVCVRLDADPTEKWFYQELRNVQNALRKKLMYSCTDVSTASIADDELWYFFKNEPNFRNKIEDL